MKYQLHPACAAWPEMPPGALRELAEDIAANGLHEPLTLTPDGLLLDGRNRALACEIAGVEPTTVAYVGDPMRFSVSKNARRRHMNREEILLAAASLVTTKRGMKYWAAPYNFEPRPEGVAPRQFVEPATDLTGDQVFALRREEFEQWLVRRKEALENGFGVRARPAFEAEVKTRVEARMAELEARGRVFTEQEFTSIQRCLHPDSRRTASEKALTTAFQLFEGARNRLVLKTRAKRSA
jgi:hypothetical protein